MSDSNVRNKINRKIVAGGFVVVALVLLVLGTIQPVSAWTRIAPIHINNTGGNAQAYYPVRLVVPYDSDMNNDFSDIRVVENETYNFIPYWIENKSDGEWCVLWFNATYIPANSWSNDTYYLLYGNASASSASNGTATFELFDDNFLGLAPLTEVFIDQHNATYPRVWSPRIARMPNGRLLAVYNKRSTENDDNHYNEIWGAFSDDNGASWGTPFLIEGGDPPNWGACEPSLLVVNESRVLLTYLRWYSTSDSRIYRKVSTDNGTTWGDDIQINTSHSYNCQTKNGIKMQDGTLILPFSWDSGSWVMRSAILRSTDGGETWVEGGQVPASGIGTNGEDEPTVVELSNHSLYMLMRNDGGHLLESISTDKGDSWTTPVASDLVSPNSNACLFRLSWSPNKILVAWDDSPTNRYPLKIAMSTDDCNTWTNIKTIKSPGYDVAYPSIGLSSDDHIIVAWWDKPGATDDVKSTRFTEDWLTGGNKWKEYGSGTKTITNGILNYSGETGSTNEYGDAIESQTNFSSPVALRVRYKFNDIDVDKYATIGFGRYSGTTADTHYATEIFCRHFVTANATGTRNLYSHGNESLDWRIMDIKWLSNSVEFEGHIDGTTYSHIFTSYVPSDSIPVQFGASWNTNEGNFNISLDWILVRKYNSPEPLALLGAEQSIGGDECTAPAISSLTNSTPTTNSVVITWTTNQSADNRVKYSKNSDLSNPLWSSWDNDTTSVSITLTGLEANTTYYYQAWSYNGTNSSCYTVEPSSQPYRSFTTQSSGGQYTITLAQGYNMIGWTSTTPKTASELCSIVPNCTYVYLKIPDGSWKTKPCGDPGDEFTVSRGFGFLAYITQECDWTRDE